MAFPALHRTSPDPGEDRRRIDARSEELARLTALDTGNALRTQARPEVTTLANLFRYFAGVAGEIKGTVLPAGDDQLQYSRQEPLGVIGAILPWNSPLMIAGFKIPAASSPATPSSSRPPKPHRSASCCSPRSAPNTCPPVSSTSSPDPVGGR